MKKKKVFVGLSGGVDSSVSAALLKARGFDVTGVFIKGWYPDWQECNWKEDRRDAMRVCAHLDIPFLTLDLEKEYKREVVDYMIREYKAGRTPNPDVMCNKEIKFGAFLKFARAQDADYVATGHYAQIYPQPTTNHIQRTQKKPESSIVGRRLLVGADSAKDQSYFLWTLTQNQLKHILFPVGHLQKTQVRKLAKKYGLSTAEKKDSQGLCFIGKVDMKDFLSHYLKPKKGKVLDNQGNVIGSHNGAIFLTIGQRHGFEIKNKVDVSKPYYIVSKDINKNSITVSDKTVRSISRNFENRILLMKINWVRGEPSHKKLYEVRLRYRQKLLKAKIRREKNNWIVELNKPTDEISPGQSLVVYSGDTLIGGGVVK